MRIADIESWYRRYGPMVLRRCRRMLSGEEEARDAMQDVFVRVLRRAADLKDGYPSSLLYTTATNVCLNRIRSKKRRPESGLEPDSLADPAGTDPEARSLITSVLEREDGLTRTIVYLYHVDGLTLQEISRETGLSVSGVRKRMTSLYRRAREFLGGGDHDQNPRHPS